MAAESADTATPAAAPATPAQHPPPRPRHTATPAAAPATPAAAPATPAAAPATPAAAPATPAAHPQPRRPTGHSGRRTRHPGRRTPQPRRPTGHSGRRTRHPGPPSPAGIADRKASATRPAPDVSPATPAAEPAMPGRPGERDAGGTGQQPARQAARPWPARLPDRPRPRPPRPGRLSGGRPQPASPARRSGPAGRLAGRGQEPAGHHGGASAAKPPSALAQPEPSRPEDPATGYLEAVAAYRALADTNPGKYRADLARALTNLGLRLSGLERPDEALQAGREALAILRELEKPTPMGSGSEPSWRRAWSAWAFGILSWGVPMTR